MPSLQTALWLAVDIGVSLSSLCNRWKFYQFGFDCVVSLDEFALVDAPRAFMVMEGDHQVLAIEFSDLRFRQLLVIAAALKET